MIFYVHFFMYRPAGNQGSPRCRERHRLQHARVAFDQTATTGRGRPLLRKPFVWAFADWIPRGKL
jgi:hypothetical protein